MSNEHKENRGEEITYNQGQRFFFRMKEIRLCSRDDFYKVVKREVRKIGYHRTIEDCEYQTKGYEMKFNLLGSNSTEMKAFNRPSLTLGERN